MTRGTKIAAIVLLPGSIYVAALVTMRIADMPITPGVVFGLGAGMALLAWGWETR